MVILRKNKIHFTSLGCARNLVDTEVMIGLLLKEGYEIVGIEEEADFLVVNTCGFLEASRQEAIDVIDELFEMKKPDAKLIVAGCMVQKKGDMLKKLFPNIHYMVGSGDVEKILNAVKEDEGSEISNAKSYLEWGEVPRMLSTPQHYAYLKIAEGCKKRCSFCIIPAIKGPLKSKTKERVLQEFNSLLSQGVYEVILIAQDLGDYGKDRKEKNALYELIREMLKDKRKFWIRFLYLYPDEITDELIEIMQSDKRICPYLDMPIQHINDRVLKLMHRKTNREQIITTIEKLRALIPNIVIRSSLMVGFPSETQEEFEELISFVNEYKLDHIGVFTYSKEEESYSAGLDGHLPQDVKEERKERLMQAQLEVVSEKSSSAIGKKLEVLIEGYHPDSEHLLTGRHIGQCPDIDGSVIINDFSLVDSFSALYEVEVTDSTEYDLIGRVTKKIPIKSGLTLV